ncbi:hypothetical protein PFLCHA0_c29000 [Pseudomonas protegens CHA0]|uniref:Uncharacterized protein n=1 Tax=Pseudomonas protegens (strain DSM 19095 / LMG 27888 / CFBP 6595 / CHA0) TaxID=1124983 RepID=A0A2C9ELZ0_PSEPH|nr:hypothetical protein PFLCHA0_c29000 [Pseudomonas protegens CHA0]
MLKSRNRFRWQASSYTETPKFTPVGAGLPAKGPLRLAQGLKAPSLASQPLHPVMPVSGRVVGQFARGA